MNEDLEITDELEFSSSEDNETENETYIIFVNYIGIDSDKNYVYQFLFSNHPEDAWGESWNEKPACNCRNLIPEDDMYDYVLELKTDCILLDLAQDNCCFSMQDVRDRCTALAYENLDEVEEYPENGRIVIQFGDKLSDVELMFAKRDIKLDYV